MGSSSIYLGCLIDLLGEFYSRYGRVPVVVYLHKDDFDTIMRILVRDSDPTFKMFSDGDSFMFTLPTGDLVVRKGYKLIWEW